VTSQISPNSIDPTFPIAGVDNDSQGFRNNFTNILNNFSYAASEISALQNSTVQIGTSNNLAGTTLSNAILQNMTLLYYDLGTVSGNVSVNVVNGNSQQITPSAPINLSIVGWPAAGYFGFVRIRFVITNTAYVVVIPANTTGLAELAFTKTGTYEFEFSSVDNGTTLQVTDITRGVGPSYNYVGNVASGFNLTAASTLIIDPSTSLAAGTVNLWNVTDGQTVTVSSSQTVTALTLVGNAGVTVNGTVTTLPANTPIKYIYVAQANAWFRLV
jgi:hypothetical protein